MNPRLVLLILTALFLLSPIMAWLLHSGWTGWNLSVESGKNHGELIHPARPLRDFNLADRSGNQVGEDAFTGFWTILLPVGEGCAIACQQNIYKMRQIRLALGKDAGRVQRVVLEDNFRLPDQVLDDNPGTRVFTVVSGGQSMLARFPGYSTGGISAVSGKIYLVDPLANLVMGYPADVKPTPVLKDLRQLLKASWIRPRNEP